MLKVSKTGDDSIVTAQNTMSAAAQKTIPLKTMSK